MKRKTKVLVMAPIGAASNFVASLFNLKENDKKHSMILKSNEYYVYKDKWVNNKNFELRYLANRAITYIRTHSAPNLDYSGYEIETLCRIHHDETLRPFLILMTWVKQVIKGDVQLFGGGLSFDKMKNHNPMIDDNFDLLVPHAKNVYDFEYGDMFLDLNIPEFFKEFEDEIIEYSFSNFDILNYWMPKHDELVPLIPIVKEQEKRFKKAFLAL